MFKKLFGNQKKTPKSKQSPNSIQQKSQQLKAVLEFLQVKGLSDKNAIELPIPGEDQQAIAIEIIKLNMYDCWTLFKDNQKELNVWPVIHISWSLYAQPWEDAIKQDNIFDRYPFDPEDEDSKDLYPNALINRVPMISKTKVIDEHDQIYSEDLEEQIEYIFDSLALESSTKQALAKRASDLSFDSYVAFNRWLAKQVEVDTTDVDQEKPDASYLEWFEPENQHYALVLLPIDQSWKSLAYLHFYGAESIGSESCMQMLQNWHERYGAELVAHYGTMLQMKIADKPKTLVEAMELALEQEALAPCTTALPGVSLMEHAKVLMHQDEWFLHERP